MSLFDRIILTIYTFFLTILSLMVIAVSAGLIPVNILWTGVERIHGHWEPGLIGLVFFLVSIRLLLAGVKTTRGTIIHETSLGQVHISLDAVENLVQKVARQVKGVRAIKARIFHTPGGIGVRLKAVVSPETNIPSVSDEIQNRVQSYIQNTVGVTTTEVRIFVENISSEFGPRVRTRLN